MDITAITQVISTVGFPIAMCCLMGYYIKYTEDRHREEVSELTKAVSNNTLVLQKLIAMLENN